MTISPAARDVVPSHEAIQHQCSSCSCQPVTIPVALFRTGVVAICARSVSLRQRRS